MPERGWNLRGPRAGLRGPANPMWKGDDAVRGAKHDRARRLYPTLGTCACGAPAVERHHVDDNPGNNEPTNVALVCRRCHMKADGRLARFEASSASKRGPQPPKPCSNCRIPAKPLRRGRCRNCAEYFRRSGVERPSSLFRETPGGPRT